MPSPGRTDPDIDNPKDIVYAEGPARPSRLEVRIPAASVPPAAIIPAAAISLSPAAATLSSLAPNNLPIAAISSLPATSSDQARPVLLLLVRVISDIIINKD